MLPGQGLLAQSPPSAANTLQPTLRFTHLTADEGLAQNSVQAILQDRQGFLWFGTRNGLSRFDGYTVVTFQHDPNNPHSLPDNSVTALLEDTAGMIWVTTEQGASRFDPRAERFTSFATTPPMNPLAGDRLLSIYQDHKGTFWFGGLPPSGLIRYDPALDRLTQFRIPPILAPVEAGALLEAPQGAIGQSVEDQAGDLWFVTERALSQYDEQQEKFKAYSITSSYPQETGLKTLLRGDKDDLWAGGATGLFQFDQQRHTFTHIADSPNAIQTLYRDRQGVIWLGAQSGLYRFDPQRKSFLATYQHNPNLPFSLNHNQVNTLYQDRAGVLWIGTENGGVDRIDPRQYNFTTYAYDPLRSQTLAGNEVQAITGDSQSIWLAVGSILHQIDRNSLTVTQYQVPDNHEGNDTIRSLLLDHTGKLWLGMKGYRLLMFDPASAHFTEQELAPASEWLQPGPPAEVSVLYEDALGNLWVVVSRHHLYRLDAQRQSLITYQQPDRPDQFVDDPNNPSRADLTAITADATGGIGGELWFGYANGSLSHYDPQSNRFRHYPNQNDLLPQPPPPLCKSCPPPPCKGCPPPPKGAKNRPPPPITLPLTLPLTMSLTLVAETTKSMPPATFQGGLGGQIAAMWVDQQGQLWLATRGGLIRFDPDRQTVKRYTEQDGLPTSYLVGMLADQSGHLWLSTLKGLSRFDPATERFRNYDVNDGLQGNEFLPNAAWMAEDGTLYFGGTNGITHFNASQIRDDVDQPPVLLTDLYLFNQPVAIGDDSLLQQAIWATDKLTLAPGQAIVSFEFASLSFGAPQKNRYRYKLDGFERAWNEVDSRRRIATYTSLPAGHYTFRVQGSNADGLWSEHEVALTVEVLPPWWQTLWFRLLSVSTLMGLLFAGYSYRVRSVEQRNRLLEEQVRQRTQALSDSEARFRGLATSTFEAILVHEQGQLLDANHAAEELFGFGREALLSHPLAKLLPTLSIDPITAPVTSATEVQGLTATGSLIPLEARCRQVPFQGRDATVVTLHNLSERKQVEAQQQQVAAFEERERIGRDLHDNLGQVIGYMSIQAQTVSDLLDQTKEAQARAALRQLVDAAHAAHADIRQYILNIRSPAAESSPRLVDALHLYLDQVAERYALAVDLSLPSDLPDNLLSAEAEAQLLRIIQEAITNIYKHAGVQRARITFTLHPDELQVMITDEGKGFTLESRENGKRKTENGVDSVECQIGEQTPHFGLAIMRERTEGIGGRLDIRSKPGAGTQIIVHLPRLLLLSAPGKAHAEELRGLRVLLVDDHPLYVQGLRNLLSARGIQVVGMAHNGDEALHLARKLLPDLILMDIDMPHGNGIEATRAIKEELPDIKIVMLTVAAAEETLFKALKQGASGYLLKNLEAEQLFEMLRQATHGEMVLSPQLASKILASYHKPPTVSPPACPAVLDSPTTEKTEETQRNQDESIASTASSQFILTYRQQQVLELVAQGLSNKEIAHRLGITERTVKFHVGAILEGFQLRSRFELTHVVYKVKKGEGVNRVIAS